MDKILNILLVGDVPSDAELIWCEINKSKIAFQKLLVSNKNDFIHALKSYNPDIIISDYSLSQFDGMTALILRNELAPLLPFILITGPTTEEEAMEHLKAGADDYILKGNLTRLGQAVANSIEKVKLQNEIISANEELRKSELRHQKAQSIVHIGTWKLDLFNKTVRCSKEALRIYGFNTESHEIPLDILRKSALPEYRPVLDEAFDNLLKYNEIFEVEYIIKRTTDNALRSVYSKGELIEIDEDKNIEFFGIIQDITDRKENEAELIRAKEKAEENDMLRTAFMQNISHEIRTPMNAIVGFSALLGEPDIDKESQKSYIEIIMQNGNRLLSVITDIVDISHIEANLVRIDKKGLNINETLKRLYNQFILKAKEKKLDLTYQTDLADSDAFIVTDGTKLIQIISNLLSNALKFTDKGYVKFGYVVRTVDIEFFVEDTGTGIQQEYHSKIFDRFYKVENQKSRLYEGTGLGLTISKAFVELLGGKIWLSSYPRKLTAFFFTIPYEKQALKTLIHNETVTAGNIVFPVHKTILVAEDLDSSFDLIKYFLSGANTSIIRARNGKEAVAKFLLNSNIDLIIMDIGMPVMDGYTAVKLIRKKNNTIPIIVQTAYADDKTHAIEIGCTGFISKPFDKKELLKVLSEFI
ncbi:MAG: response regulator [Nitrospirota bacterium]|nr:response regulator [Nitrospirota bacterium]